MKENTKQINNLKHSMVLVWAIEAIGGVERVREQRARLSRVISICGFSIRSTVTQKENRKAFTTQEKCKGKRATVQMPRNENNNSRSRKTK